MDDAELVRLGQRVGDLRGEPGGLGGRHGPFPFEVVAQAAAGHQVHHQAEGLADAEQVAHPDHVAVPEHQENGPFLHEPGDQPRLAQQALVQQLHRDRFTGGVLHAFPDRAGRALPDRFDEPVGITDTPSGKWLAVRGILHYSGILPPDGNAPRYCDLSV